MFDTQPLLSAPAHLLLHFDRLTEQMRGEPAPWFRQDEHAPDYELARDSGDLQHNGFRIYSGRQDAFIHVRRDGPSHGGYFVGDKLHLSVEREQVPQAFKAMAGLLLGDDCPIDEWKVTDMQRVAPDNRVSEGAQFTLYIKPDKESSQYTAQGSRAYGLTGLRAYGLTVFCPGPGKALIEQQIRPGQRLDSDVYPAHWQYSSYRNEWRSEREGSEVQRRALQEEPFYRLITQ